MAHKSFNACRPRQTAARRMDAAVTLDVAAQRGKRAYEVYGKRADSIGKPLGSAKELR